MPKTKRDLGQFLADTNCIPESLQIALAGGAIVSFLALWLLDVAPLVVLLPGTFALVTAIYFVCHRIPALRTSLRVYEHGLESIVRGDHASFAYDELSGITARLTDHLVNRQYIGTKARLEFLIADRLSPYVHECEFRRGLHGERVVALAINRCSEAIESQLLAQLERDGKLPWWGNVSLTPDGLLLTEPGGPARLVPYDQIGAWKIEDNQLKLWKGNDALPFFVMSTSTPNFTPLFSLFESLCQAIRNLQPAP